MEIPVPPTDRTAGKQEDSQAGERENPAKGEAVIGRQNHRYEVKPDGERRESSEARESTLSRKAAIALCAPVPQTDTGRRGENPQADGRSVVKELGKMTP